MDFSIKRRNLYVQKSDDTCTFNFQEQIMEPMTNIDKYLIVFVWISTSRWKFVATNIFCSLQNATEPFR